MRGYAITSANVNQNPRRHKASLWGKSTWKLFERRKWIKLKHLRHDVYQNILSIHIYAHLIKCFHQTLQWSHNDQDGVSNHQPRGCLLNRLFRRRSKKTSKLRVTGLCVGNSPGPVNSPHKGPVTREMFPFDDVIMKSQSKFHLQQPCQEMVQHTGANV